MKMSRQHLDAPAMSKSLERSPRVATMAVRTPMNTELRMKKR